MSQDHDGSSRIDAIDGLRAVAVLAVIAFHFHTGVLAAGYIGVDVFFVISGYVISGSLAQHELGSFSSYITAFYRRRVIRLLPALLCCLAVTSLLSIMLVPDSWLSDSNHRTAVLASLGLGNVGLLLKGTDGYFQARSEFNPFVHTWSLGVEEQFYLFFPLAFWFWLKASRQSGAAPSPWRWLALWAVPLLGAASCAWSAFETVRTPQWAFYMLPSRFWELAAGAAMFQAHARGRLIPAGRWTGIVAIAGVLVLAAGFVWTDGTAFPFPWALAPVCGTMALIAASRADTPSPGALLRVLRSPVAVYIGRISYSLYLWHWPVVCLLRWTVGFSGAPVMVSALLLTAALGVASYHFIERPAQRAQWLRKLPPLTAVAGAGAVAALFAVALFVAFRVESPLRLSVVDSQRGWHATDLPSPADRDPATPPSRSRRLFVIGDSHAGAYEGMVQRAASRLGLQAEVTTVAGCPIANLLESYADKSFCRGLIDSTLEDVQRRARPGDVVFLASLRSYRISDQWGEIAPVDLQGAGARLNRAAALAEARSLLQRLRALNLTVIMDTPKPVFRAPPFRCGDWFNHMNPVCAPGFQMDRNTLLARDVPVRNSLAVLQHEFPDLVVWDPFPVLCPDQTCSVFRAGKPLFFDADHLSGYGNEALLPSFEQLLRTVLAGRSPGARDPQQGA